jgi:transposase
VGVVFKPLDRGQQYLLPPSVNDWLPEGDLAYFLIDVSDQLDLSELYRYYQVAVDPETGEERPKAASGQPAYHPKMMVALLLYGYATGQTSSRRIAHLCERDAGYRVVAANQWPDFRTISEFRRIHLEALSGLFVQVLLLAREAGLVKLGHVALDGTKVKANASKHKAMSYEWLIKREAEYAKQVADLLRRADETDTAEDGLYGADLRGDELPKELRFREERLKRIREAKRALEAAALEKARAEGKLDENDQPKPSKGGRPPKTPPGEPKPKDQYNFTDNESHIMKMNHGGFDQAYNCQAAVDDEAQVIVACDATAESNDKKQLTPLLDQVEENLGALPKKASADSGYYSEENVRDVRARGIDDYICPDRMKHGEPVPKVRGRPPKDMSFIDRVRRKLRTKQGRATYKLRKQIVEPVFGQMKGARGLRQFLLRGVEKVQGEWSLWCTGHNLRKLWLGSLS